MKFIASAIVSLLMTAVFLGEKGFSKEVSIEERRAENERIQSIIKATQQVNKKPDPAGSPRATRVARNRYRNQHPPIFPKTMSSSTDMIFYAVFGSKCQKLGPDSDSE